MVGVVPRVVWSRVIEADEKNRIELAHNCLLMERVEPIATGDNGPRPPRKLIIETGTGDKLDEKMSSIFGLDGRTAESAGRAWGARAGAARGVGGPRPVDLRDPMHALRRWRLVVGVFL